MTQAHHTQARYAFVKARWHADIVDRALDGFLELIPAAQVDVFDVPGAFGGQAQYDGRDWEIDGRQVHLYGIGSGAWCWRRLDRR